MVVSSLGVGWRTSAAYNGAPKNGRYIDRITSTNYWLKLARELLNQQFYFWMDNMIWSLPQEMAKERIDQNYETAGNEWTNTTMDFGKSMASNKDGSPLEAFKAQDEFSCFRYFQDHLKFLAITNREKTSLESGDFQGEYSTTELQKQISQQTQQQQSSFTPFGKSSINRVAPYPPSQVTYRRGVTLKLTF